MHRIRLAMTTGTFEKLSGTVEIDETFVGGLARNMHASERAKLTGTGGADKTMVVGALERGTDERPSRVTASVAPDRTRPTLHAIVHGTVNVGSTVYTDAWTSYLGLNGLLYTHQFIDHAVTYVEGQVHTNGIESFWTLFKRGAKGVYTHITPKHLNRCVAERVFTFNEREVSDGERMRTAVAGVAGRQLTYAELTA